MPELNDQLKAIHDKAVVDGATHEASTCPICTPSTSKEAAKVSDESVAALRERDDEIARLKAQITQIETSQAQTDVEQQVATAKAEAEAAAKVEIDDLQTKYDEAALEAGAAKKSYEDLKTLIESAKSEAEAAEAKAQIEAARQTSVAPFKELLGEKYLTENASRFAAMDDDSFQALVEGWKAALGERAPTDTKIPAATAMVASGDWAPRVGSHATRSLLQTINAAADRGVDIKRI